MSHTINEVESMPDDGQVAEGTPARSPNIYCTVPPTREPVFGPHIGGKRAALIITNFSRWVNGTVIKYYFFDKPGDGMFGDDGTGQLVWYTWVGAEDQRETVRRAFNEWKQLGIGLIFQEVSEREDAEVRIGFMQNGRSWSYVGRQALDFGPNERTMNFGWDLVNEPGGDDTALHEIGHALGFHHEHQNPNAGIEWDVEAVHKYFMGEPNNWKKEDIDFNVLRKLTTFEAAGSNWDPNSIMHYWFGPGLIRRPEQYADGLYPAGGLTSHDILWIRRFYPPLDPVGGIQLQTLRPALLDIDDGQQLDFIITPTSSRYYELQTLGRADVLAVIFEDVDSTPVYVSGEDQMASDQNIHFRLRLFAGRRYILRIRLVYRIDPEVAVMLW